MTEPQWIEIPALDPWSSSAPNNHGEHSIEAVSRHSIAESGLICPRCGTEIGIRGDYFMVRRCRLGEVVKCVGKRQLQDGIDRPCNTYLVASPDTEHGDNVLWDTIPKEDRHQLFHTFVRVSQEDMIKQKYGDDMQEKPGDELVADAARALVKPPEPVRPRFSYKEGEVYHTNNGRFIGIHRVQTNNDPLYHGWAWGSFIEASPQHEWSIDPFGLIRFSMADPTLNDTVRLTRLSPPV